MSKTVKAVTVTKDYLNKKIWVVKLLSIFNRKDGTPYWFVSNIIYNNPDYLRAASKALLYGIDNKVAYIQNVKHGQPLTELHKDLLATFDKLK